ncbi:hypothetical protein Tco_1284456 [Tanacetum coccineum]
MFETINLDYLYNIDEPICPTFLLEFYSQVNLIRNEDQTLSIKFWILHEQFTLTLEYFANNLRIPCKGQCAYTEKCSLKSLTVNQEKEVHPQLKNPKYQLFTHVMGLMGHYDDHFDGDFGSSSDEERDE